MSSGLISSMFRPENMLNSYKNNTGSDHWFNNLLGRVRHAIGAIYLIF
jgi:hypothetical protein